MPKQKKIMWDSPEAASLKTVTGWVSSTGHFFGDNERAARYSGSTHKLCETCGQEMETRSYCRPCRNNYDIERFHALPEEPWDGESPVYSDALDKYFFHGEVFDYYEDEHCSLESLRLVHCEPNYLHTLDSDTWENELSTDDDSMDLPAEVQAALDALNVAIKAAPPVTWYPGKTRVKLPLDADAIAANNKE